MSNLMPTLDSNEELQQRVRKCFTDTEMEHDEEMTYFDTDQTIDNLVQLILADREAAVREALYKLGDYYDHNYPGDVGVTWDYWIPKYIASLNQPTKEGE